LAKDRPPVCGRLQRGGHVGSHLLAHVQQKPIEPLLNAPIVPGTRVSTDAYSLEARRQAWGYGHTRVNHGRGELARDDDGDGLCAVHVNTMEGLWSLLRSWLCPPRGSSQEQLPVSLGCFEFVPNVRKRGKALLPALIELLVT
jgi:transposase